MPSNRASNFGYWKNRAQSAESLVERQHKLISDQQEQINRLTNELGTLRRSVNPITIRDPSTEELSRMKAELGKTKGGE